VAIPTQQSPPRDRREPIVGTKGTNTGTTERGDTNEGRYVAFVENM